jgi:hypothetical protein
LALVLTKPTNQKPKPTGFGFQLFQLGLVWTAANDRCDRIVVQSLWPRFQAIVVLRFEINRNRSEAIAPNQNSSQIVRLKSEAIGNEHCRSLVWFWFWHVKTKLKLDNQLPSLNKL